MKQVYAPNARKVCLLCLEDASRVLSFCWVTTATLTRCEHRVAVGTAADSLRHMLVRTLCPILDSSSSK